MFKNRISAATERTREKEPARNRPDLGEGGKSVRTLLHVCHFPDLPRGEITIEGTSIFKHCTTAATKKSPRIKMGWKKKRREHCSTIELVQAQKEEGKIETATIKDKMRLYILACMVVTFPTCHLERSPLKSPAYINTAPHSNKEKSKDKNGLHCSK